MFKVVHGDITTKEKSSSNNIVRKVTEEVKSFADKNGFSKNDFLKVIHIVDTDGAFISNDKVILNQSIVKEDSPKYYDNKVECLNKKDIEKFKANTELRELLSRKLFDESKDIIIYEAS